MDEDEKVFFGIIIIIPLITKDCRMGIFLVVVYMVEYFDFENLFELKVQQFLITFNVTFIYVYIVI